MKTPTTITVFEYRGSGQKKIKGIREFGKNIEITSIHNIEEDLPSFIENPEDFITEDFNSDIVLCFIKHPDLCDYLADICCKKNIPIIASGTKTSQAITPFTCCGLGQHKNLGHYGEQFGVPEIKVTVQNNKIAGLEVLRGASCGATWDIEKKIIGLTIEDALPSIAREVQYLCIADPSAFDPISGKSSLHYAGDVHISALKKALKEIF